MHRCVQNCCSQFSSFFRSTNSDLFPGWDAAGAATPSLATAPSTTFATTTSSFAIECVKGKVKMGQVRLDSVR